MFITLISIPLLVALLIGLNALYVAGEFAAVSARKSRIIQSAQEGNRLALILVPVMEDHHKLDNYIAASQVGITLSSIMLGIYGQRQIAPLISPLLAGISGEVAAVGLSAILILIFLTTLQVVLGELVPKTVALRYPERTALLTALPMQWSADIVLRPLIIFLNGSGALLMRILGLGYEAGHKHMHSPEEIQLLMRQSHEGGLLDEEEIDLLANAFRFSQLRAGEVVRPRTHMVAAALDTPLHDILQLAIQTGYTRIPIYEDTLDNILGFVHLKEVFQLYQEDPAQGVQSILREPVYVPETALIDDVWAALNEKETYVAIVLDEYGGTTGMVTREDLLEELFGEVQDEFDLEDDVLFQTLEEGVYEMRGDMAISYLNSQLDLTLPTDTAYTIGGLVLNALGRMPRRGDKVVLDGVRLVVKAVDDKAVERVRLTLPDDSNLGEEA